MSGSDPVATWLRRQREALGLSAADVAGAVGVSAAFISLIESGRKRPGREKAALLAKVLELPEEALLAWLRIYSPRDLEDVRRALEKVASHLPADLRSKGLGFAALAAGWKPLARAESSWVVARHALVEPERELGLRMFRSAPVEAQRRLPERLMRSCSEVQELLGEFGVLLAADLRHRGILPAEPPSGSSPHWIPLRMEPPEVGAAETTPPPAKPSTAPGSEEELQPGEADLALVESLSRVRSLAKRLEAIEHEVREASVHDDVELEMLRATLRAEREQSRLPPLTRVLALLHEGEPTTVQAVSSALLDSHPGFLATLIARLASKDPDRLLRVLSEPLPEVDDRLGLVRAPLIAEGEAPRDGWRAQDAIKLDRRVLPEAVRGGQTFAYQLTESGVRYAPDLLSPGDVAILTPDCWPVEPGELYAVRVRNTVVLSRVALKPDALLVLPSSPDVEAEVLPLGAKEADRRPAALLGHVVTVIRRSGPAAR